MHAALHMALDLGLGGVVRNTHAAILRPSTVQEGSSCAGRVLQRQRFRGQIGCDGGQGQNMQARDSGKGEQVPVVAMQWGMGIYQQQ